MIVVVIIGQVIRAANRLKHLVPEIFHVLFRHPKMLYHFVHLRQTDFAGAAQAKPLIDRAVSL